MLLRVAPEPRGSENGSRKRVYRAGNPGKAKKKRKTQLEKKQKNNEKHKASLRVSHDKLLRIPLTAIKTLAATPARKKLKNKRKNNNNAKNIFFKKNRKNLTNGYKCESSSCSSADCALSAWTCRSPCRRPHTWLVTWV